MGRFARLSKFDLLVCSFKQPPFNMSSASDYTSSSDEPVSPGSVSKCRKKTCGEDCSHDPQILVCKGWTKANGGRVHKLTLRLNGHGTTIVPIPNQTPFIRGETGSARHAGSRLVATMPRQFAELRLLLCRAKASRHSRPLRWRPFLASSTIAKMFWRKTASCGST